MKKQSSNSKKTSLLFKSGDDWSPAIINNIYNECAKIAYDEMKLDIYPNTLEIVTAEMMVDIYSSHGMPVNYNHWSFGKDFLRNWKSYSKGQQNLAYELVINSSPCISYLMEENNATMQMLVIAHAAFGHNHFFKNNFMFKQFTDATAIVDYLDFAKKYILLCEEKYGIDRVEKLIDSAHALALHGIDKYTRKNKKRLSDEQRVLEQKMQAEEDMKYYDDVFERTVLKKKESSVITSIDHGFLDSSQENILYFIEKHSQKLTVWEKEIVRIIRVINQYFYPQLHTKVANEGFATFTHYYIVNRLYEKGLIDEGTLTEFFHSHTNVVYQPLYYQKWYNGLNPYALGFKIFSEIKRICDNPTEEDKYWFPDLIGQHWADAVKFAVANYKDDSFIQQYLSPKAIRDLKLFAIQYYEDDAAIAIDGAGFYVNEIHDDIGYRNVRETLGTSYDRSNFIPDIQVIRADMKNNRELYLQYTPYQGRPLHSKTMKRTLEYTEYLWGYPVTLVSDSTTPKSSSSKRSH